MENQKNNKGIIALLIVVILVLAVLCILLATGTISFNSNSVDNNQTNDNTSVSDQDIIEAVEITNLTFSEPRAGGFGGGDINTLVVDASVNLACSNEKVAGIRLSGYCLDKNDYKYLIDGPVEVMAFYCDNNMSHVDSAPMSVNQVLEPNGNGMDLANIKWEEVDIKYCKIDNAKFILTDGSILSTEKELNYEKEY